MNKASGCNGIPVELFQNLKDDAVKVLHSICQQIWKTHQWPQDWKRSVFIPIPKKGNAKECSSYCTIALISHASKVMLKILQARLQQYENCEIADVQAEFRKVRGTTDQIASVHWIIEKAREFQKNISVSQFSCSVVSTSLRLHGLQHARPTCPSPTPEFTQTHVHGFGDAIQPSHPLTSPSPPTFNLSQHQGLFKRVSSSS